MAENETAHSHSTVDETGAVSGATRPQYSTPERRYCPIAKGDCNRLCVFRDWASGCAILTALQHIPAISGNIAQIADDIATLTSEPEAVLDAAMESM